jgi:hypothetical protein
MKRRLRVPSLSVFDIMGEDEVDRSPITQGRATCIRPMRIIRMADRELDVQESQVAVSIRHRSAASREARLEKFDCVPPRFSTRSTYCGLVEESRRGAMVARRFPK